MKLSLDTWDLNGVYQGFQREVPSSIQSVGPDMYHQLYTIPANSGTGYLERWHLREGLELNWIDTQMNVPLIMDVDVHYPHLEISYTLSGSGCWETSADAAQYELAAGVSTLISIRNTKLHAEMSHQERMLHMELRFDLRQFQGVLPAFERANERAVFCTQVSKSPIIAQLVDHMRQCPYTGALKRMYLEGKALELLAFHLDGMDREERSKQTVSKLTRYDMQCLHEARSILTKEWQEPPSLLGLARLTGLNDYKLKLGFKELFGTTVYGYVREKRMSEARKLLEQGKANVSETAFMVGYQNVSHFAKVFRKTYGYNPSEIVKQATDRSV
ncbi:helix-turn-helix transcriptional regulator [Paenibacillus sp. 1001270B_150601_E10]|uniref:helix-turn-helix transcriptional regulator n=1 Tax=Paenibacillus sp. 1001270B_150601_E10 TaxID=2787079 RepID=UPI00189D42A9|nr:AraC family transcriptional regulator [Paenibacillus sp. 1001270B_150601_E10]